MKKAVWSIGEVKKLEELKNTHSNFTVAVQEYNKLCRTNNWPERSINGCRFKLTGDRKHTTGRRKWDAEEKAVIQELKRKKNPNQVYDEFIKIMKKKSKNEQYVREKESVINEWAKNVKMKKRWDNVAFEILKTIMDVNNDKEKAIDMAVNMFRGDGFTTSRKLIRRKMAIVREKKRDTQLYKLAGVPIGAKLTTDVIKKLRDTLDDLIAGDREDEDARPINTVVLEEGQAEDDIEIIEIDKDEEEYLGVDEYQLDLQIQESQHHDDIDEISITKPLISLKLSVAEDICFAFSCCNDEDKMYYVSKMPKYSCCHDNCMRCCHGEYLSTGEVYLTHYNEEEKYMSLLMLGNHLDACEMVMKMRRESSRLRQEWNVKDVVRFTVMEFSTLQNLLNLHDLDYDLMNVLSRRFGCIVRHSHSDDQAEDTLHYKLGYVKKKKSTCLNNDNQQVLCLMIRMESTFLVMLEDNVLHFEIAEEIVWLPRESLLQHVRRMRAISNFKHLDSIIKRAMMNHQISFQHSNINLDDLSNIEERLNELDEFQRHVVEECLKYVGVLIVQGPYGCGKSTTITALVYSLAHITADKILITSEANAAIDAIAVKITADATLRDKMLKLGNSKMLNTDVDHYCSLAGLLKQEEERLIKRDEHITTPRLKAALKRFKRNLIKKRQIILCTLTHSFSGSIQQCEFGTCIVDEASQVTDCGILMGLRVNTKRLVMVGDLNQQPPYSSLSTDKRIRYFNGGKPHYLCYSSMESFLNRDNTYSLVMNNQYRAHPRISRYLKWFYKYPVYDNARTSNDYFEYLKVADDAEILMDRRMCFIDVVSNSQFFSEEIRKDDQKYINHCEGQFICDLLRNLPYFILPHEQKRVLIITPYSRQKRLLQYIVEETLDDEMRRRIRVDVMTIDGVQGEEGDIVILSMVRRNDKGNIGFLADNYTRALVAFSRAKDYLFVVWNQQTFEHQNIYGNLIQQARNDYAAFRCLKNISYRDLTIKRW